MIIYTANFGRKDKYEEPWCGKLPGYEFHYFTDDPKKRNGDIWDIQHEKPRLPGDTRMSAKWYKMHPHLLFPGERTIWIDSNYSVTKNPDPLLEDKELICYEHALRDCVWDELDQCIKKKADKEERLNKFKNMLVNKNFPRNKGLYQGNVLIREDTAAVRNFDREWWDLIHVYTSRDQLTLPLIIENLKYISLPHEAKRNYFFKIGKHLFHGSRNGN